MQNNRSFHARSFFLIIGALAALVVTGCSTPSVRNMTPSAITPNPSNIYTITARIKPQASNVVDNSVIAKIIIDGNAYKMTRLPATADVYEYEFQAPGGVDELRYYFLIEYQVSNVGVLKSRTDYSPLQIAKILDRNSLGLTANRGPAGARIAITGRGFTSGDNVYFDEHLARSVFESQNSISFYVPDLPANNNYTVSIGDVPGKLVIGTFRIDAGGASGASTSTGYADAGSYSTSQTAVVPLPAPAAATPAASSSTTTSQPGVLAVSPEEIKIRQGQTQVVKFIVPYIVRGTPVLIDVTTDIAESVIMPEVYVYDGSNIGSVTIEGGRPGTGHLYAKLPGDAKPLVIPITVQASN